MSEKRILGVTTTYYGENGKLMMRDSALESVKRLKTEGLRLDWMILSDNPFGPTPWANSQKNLAFKLERARKIALRMEYDYLFLHEHDIILPPDTLTKLIAAKADLATGLCRLRPTHGVGSDLALLTRVPWVASDGRTKGDVGYNERNLSAYKLKAYNRETFPVEGSGLGCFMASRRVLAAVPFRWIDSALTLDVIYASMAKRKGFKFLCVGDVQCGHEDETSIIYKVGKQYWNATMIREGNIWSQFSKIKPVSKLEDVTLHLGRPMMPDCVNYDVDPINGVEYSAPIDKLKPHLPFEDDTFTAIVVENFAEHIVDKLMLLREIWRVSEANAKIRLVVKNDQADLEQLSSWHSRTFDSLTDLFTVESQSSRKQELTWTLRSLKREVN